MSKKQMDYLLYRLGLPEEQNLNDIGKGCESIFTHSKVQSFGNIHKKGKKKKKS